MAVIGIPCNSDFGTSNKIRNNWEERVVGSSDFWAPVGRTHQECRRLILVPLASKNLCNFRVPLRSSWELRSPVLLCSEFVAKKFLRTTFQTFSLDIPLCFILHNKNLLIYSIKTQHIHWSAPKYGYMFRCFLDNPQAKMQQYKVLAVRIIHYGIPYCLQNVHKKQF